MVIFKNMFSHKKVKKIKNNNAWKYMNTVLCKCLSHKYLFDQTALLNMYKSIDLDFQALFLQ